MESLGKKIHDIRKAKGVKASDLARRIGRSPAVMSDIENDRLKGGVSPEVLIRIAESLDAPQILLHHCEHCPIRQHVMMREFPELNNIRNDPLAIVDTMRREMQEAIVAADDLAAQYTRPNFKDQPGYKETFLNSMEQILDVARVIEHLKFELVLGQFHTQEEIKEVYRRQQHKCEDHGHHNPEAA